MSREERNQNQEINRYEIQALRSLIDGDLPLGHMAGVGLPTINGLISKGFVELAGSFHEGQPVYTLTGAGRELSRNYERRKRLRSE